MATEVAAELRANPQWIQSIRTGRNVQAGARGRRRRALSRPALCDRASVHRQLQRCQRRATSRRSRGRLPRRCDRPRRSLRSRERLGWRCLRRSLLRIRDGDPGLVARRQRVEVNIICGRPFCAAAHQPRDEDRERNQYEDCGAKDERVDLSHFPVSLLRSRGVFANRLPGPGGVL